MQQLPNRGPNRYCLIIAKAVKMPTVALILKHIIRKLISFLMSSVLPCN